MTHDLKVHPAYFGPLAAGLKTFELRRADRDFRAGDVLRLREWRHGYTGRECCRRVTFVLEGRPWLADGYVALALRSLREAAPLLDEPTGSKRLEAPRDGLHGLWVDLRAAAGRMLLRWAVLATHRGDGQRRALCAVLRDLRARRQQQAEKRVPA